MHYIQDSRVKLSYQSLTGQEDKRNLAVFKFMTDPSLCDQPWALKIT